MASSASALRLRELIGGRKYVVHLGSDGNEKYECFVNIRDVPAYMIPRDILSYFGGSLQEMKAFKIYQHAEDVEKYAAIIEMSSKKSANVFVNDYFGLQLSSLEGTICDVAKVKFAEIWEEESETVYTGDKEEQYTSNENGALFLHEWNDVVHAHTCPLCLDPINATQSASQSSSPTSTPFRTSPRVSPRASPLTLPAVHSSSSQPRGYFSTCCRHYFHIDCVLNLREPQCPVCRFQHDSNGSMVSHCSTCGWRGREYSQSVTSPSSTSISDRALGAPPFSTSITPHERCSDLWMCMVCGYVGCGRSHHYHIFLHYRETMHTYVLNLDSKRVWDFAGGGFVHRLVMGSQAEEVSSSGQTFAAGAGEGDEWNEVRSGKRRNQGLTNESLCRGSTSQREGEQDVESRMKANQGQKVESLSSSNAGSYSCSDSSDSNTEQIPQQHTRSAIKMLEISGIDGTREGHQGNDFGFVSVGERPIYPPITGISDQDQEHLIHYHLESAAEEFGDALLQKMRQRRRNYEEQVRNIYRHANLNAPTTARNVQTTSHIWRDTDIEGTKSNDNNFKKEEKARNITASVGTKSKHGNKKSTTSRPLPQVWSTALLRPLLDEKKCGASRLKKAKEKLVECEEELDVIMRLNEVLSSSEKEWITKIASAERTVRDLAQENQRRRALLEGEIDALMERMNAMEAAESDAPTGDALQEEHEHQQRLVTGTGKQGTGRRGG